MHDVMYSPSRFPFHRTSVSISVGISEANGSSCVAHMVNVYACAVAFAIYEEVSRTLLKYERIIQALREKLHD